MQVPQNVFMTISLSCSNMQMMNRSSSQGRPSGGADVNLAILFKPVNFERIIAQAANLLMEGGRP